MNSAQRTPILHRVYKAYLVDQNATAFADGVSRSYSVGTLERLAANGDRMSRRAAVLALGLAADYGSNAVLGRALHDADRGVRMLAENGIRALWCRVGDSTLRKHLQSVIELNAARRFDAAIKRASKLIAQTPWLAEAWNQRALAYYSLKRYAESIHDCRQALEVNPYHFGAATGMAQCHLQLGNRLAALECFRRALLLNPNLEGVRAQVQQLQRLLKRQE
jgi:tetratricopeptide (TPR) repeat protein